MMDFDALKSDLMHYKPMAGGVSIETALASEAPAHGRALCCSWHHIGRGSLSIEDERALLISPARYDSYPASWPQDGDYVSFGEIGAAASIDREDWNAYTHLRLTVQADCRNVIAPYITLSIKNDGAIAVPDVYDREGHHVIQLDNGRCRDYVLDISSLPRDAVSEVAITFQANGSYLDTPGSWSILIRHLALETRKSCETVRGWIPRKDLASCSQIGYLSDARKLAVLNPCHIGKRFTLASRTHGPVLEGTVLTTESPDGPLGICDFSALRREGCYSLLVSGVEPARIVIGSCRDLLGPSIVKSVNFAYMERCGYPVPGIHGTCHTDVFAEHDGKIIPYCGGWHDAGDLSQQTVQTAELALSLVQTASIYERRDADLATRIREEGIWGLDFVMRMRLGKGYRASSAGVSRWTDGQIGDMDDASARVHNSPYDNFLTTGILARAYRLLPDDEPMRRALGSILLEDLDDAQRGFDREPFRHDPVMWEHTYSTSKSLYLATMIWTCSEVAKATGERGPVERAKTLIPQLLACQERAPSLLPDGRTLSGAFCRDETKRVFQHFNHQAREHLYAWALKAAREIAADDAALADSIDDSIALYSSYLKGLTGLCGPYPMIANGIYRRSEPNDRESFLRQHLLVGNEAFGDFGRQLDQGIRVSSDCAVRRFPVWFSFRGNSAVILSQAMSAAAIGRATGDQELFAIAFSQLQWLVGFNPFSQSLMYGEGERYPEIYSASSGRMIGGLPVGIETEGNEDRPYWPVFNNATYKEIWVGLAGKWLATACALIDNKEVCNG